jgi:hypothetical protein
MNKKNIKTGKVMYSKSGKGNDTAKVSIASTWLEKIGINNIDGENKIIKEFDLENNRIILRKPD